LTPPSELFEIQDSKIRKNSISPRVAEF